MTTNPSKVKEFETNYTANEMIIFPLRTNEQTDSPAKSHLC